MLGVAGTATFSVACAQSLFVLNKDTPELFLGDWKSGIDRIISCLTVCWSCSDARHCITCLEL